MEGNVCGQKRSNSISYSGKSSIRLEKFRSAPVETPSIQSLKPILLYFFDACGPYFLYHIGSKKSATQALRYLRGVLKCAFDVR